MSHPIRALLLSRTEYGDSDLIVSLFTESLGVVKARARAARVSRKRFGGALEPLHTLRVEVLEQRSSEFVTLRSARVDVARIGLLNSLERLQTAGRALAWVRSTLPPKTPEQRVWYELCALLDCLNGEGESPSAREQLLRFGLVLLTELGWALQLESCVKCGRSCPKDQSGMVSPALGGLICRACGGARRLLGANARLSFSCLAKGGDAPVIEADVTLGLALVEDTLRAHAGIESRAVQGHSRS